MAHEDDDDALLASWIEQVGLMPDEADGPDERGYKAVALELGLTEADLARVEAAVEDHLARGRNYLSHGRPGDAVDELQAARALAPWRRDVAHALAEAHVVRFHQEGQGADRAAAEGLIRSRLERDPDHQPSYTLLNRLDTPAEVAEAPDAADGDGRSPAAARRRLMIVAAGGVMLILLLSALMAPLVAPPDGPATGGAETQVAAENPPLVEPPPPEPPPPEPPAAPDAPPQPLGDFELPVEVVSWDKFEGIEIVDEGSMIKRSAYTSALIKLRVRNTLPGKSLDRLGATMEFLDEDGAVVASKRFDLLNQARASLYPGEQAPYGHRFKPTQAAVRARVILETLQRRTAVEPPKSTPICVKWDIDRPEHLHFDFGLRSQRWSLGTLYMVLTVHNRGANAVEVLDLQVEHLDAQGARVAESTILDKEMVAATWMPSFEPGELRLVHHMKVLGLDDKPRYDHTCLRITNAN